VLNLTSSFERRIWGGWREWRTRGVRAKCHRYLRNDDRVRNRIRPGEFLVRQIQEDRYNGNRRRRVGVRNCRHVEAVALHVGSHATGTAAGGVIALESGHRGAHSQQLAALVRNVKPDLSRLY